MNKSCSVPGCTIKPGEPGYEVRTGTCHANGDDWLANPFIRILCAAHAHESGLFGVLQKLGIMREPAKN